MMDFSIALALIKEGYRLRRKGWNGTGMFVYLIEGSVFTASQARGNLTEHLDAIGGGKMTYLSHIDMKTAGGTLVPWLASQTDLLAYDWEIAE